MREAIEFEGDCGPLIVLVKRDLRIDDGLIDGARDELLGRSRRHDNGFRSGHLLGVEDAAPFPVCGKLVSELRHRLIGAEEERWKAPFELSFLKAHIGEPPVSPEGPYFEGPHIDSHPGLGEDTELLRVLINLAAVPRRFLYLKSDRLALERSGVSASKWDFAPLGEVPSARRAEVEIPPRRPREVHMLRFWASMVPHVGLNGLEGQFLASFEAVVPFGRTRIAVG